MHADLLKLLFLSSDFADQDDGIDCLQSMLKFAI